MKGAFYLYFIIGTIAVFFTFYVRMQISIPYERIAAVYHERFRFFRPDLSRPLFLRFPDGNPVHLANHLEEKERLVVLSGNQIAETAAAAAVSFCCHDCAEPLPFDQFNAYL